MEGDRQMQPSSHQAAYVQLHVLGFLGALDGALQQHVVELGANLGGQRVSVFGDATHSLHNSGCPQSNGIPA